MFQESVENESISNNLLNSDIEMLGSYFDVVPDGNIFTLDMMPIFAVRLKSKGISIIASHYYKKHNINIDVISYVINCDRHTLYQYDAKLIYSDKSGLIDKIVFDQLQYKKDYFQGIAITVTNKNNGLMHTIPLVYGFDKKGNKIFVALDAYYNIGETIDENCSAILLCKFIKSHFPDAQLFVHNTKIQSDHHSCSIVACDIIKNFLIRDAKLLKKEILTSKPIQIPINDNTSILEANLINMPPEILKLSQFSSIYQSVNQDSLVTKYKIKIAEYLNNKKNTFKYYKEPEPYDSSKLVIPIGEKLQEKVINTSLILKGHQYAAIVMKETGSKFKDKYYDPNYWINLIKLKKQSTEDIKSNIITWIKNSRKIATENVDRL
jgi:hypothetical protein